MWIKKDNVETFVAVFLSPTVRALRRLCKLIDSAHFFEKFSMSNAYPLHSGGIEWLEVIPASDVVLGDIEPSVDGVWTDGMGKSQTSKWASHQQPFKMSFHLYLKLLWCRWRGRIRVTSSAFLDVSILGVVWIGEGALLGGHLRGAAFFAAWAAVIGRELAAFGSPAQFLR
jgi:hypothetical protein